MSLNEIELQNIVYGMLCDFYLLDVHFENMPLEFFEENNQGIMFKTPQEIKEILVEKQNLRRNNFKELVMECFDEGESRRVLPLKTNNDYESDFIFELKLIKIDK